MSAKPDGKVAVKAWVTPEEYAVLQGLKLLRRCPIGDVVAEAVREYVARLRAELERQEAPP